jgi:hypothetical protein
MRRRTFVLSGVGFILLATGSAAGLAHASVASIGPFPWAPPASMAVPTISPNEPSPPGGIGNSLKDLEQTYGSPDGLQGTMISFRKGAIAATFTVQRATSVFVSFGNTPVPELEIARGRIQGLLPPDSTLVGTVGAGPGRVADIYHSNRLASKMPAGPASPRPGQFVVVYQSDSTGAFTQALLTVGGVPAT